MGSKMRGLHPFWIVCDDILSDAVISSFDQNIKTISLFHSVIMNLLEPQGQIVVIGTPFMDIDLYGDLKGKKRWLVLEYPGIFPDGTLLWSNKFSFRTLIEKLETQGSLNFTREILVKPITAESSVFPKEFIERAYVGMEKFTLATNIVSFPEKFDEIVIGTDFAISASQGADSTSFVVVGVKENKYWILHMFTGKGMSYDEQMSKLKGLNAAFLPTKIMIETNQMQKIFYQMGIDMGLPVLEHFTGTDKYSLEKGLPALAVLFETHRMRIPRGDDPSRRLSDQLAHELSSYTYDGGKLVSTRGHSDLGMALWQAILAAHYRGSFDFSFI
jgi:hypothetical protein